MTLPKEKSELEGSLSQFNLSDIVQFLSGSAKTGLLRMTAAPSGQMGAIFFVDGSVVHAETAHKGTSGERIGEDAFFELMMWTEGKFDFVPGVAPGDKTVRQSSTNLLLEGARRKDEWSVLSKIDGHRSLKEIAESASITDYDACRLIYPLLVNKLIRLRARRDH